MTDMDFLDLLTKAGPFVISAGGVAACVWLAVKIVPEERKAASIEREATRKESALEREAARKDYLEALTKTQDKFITTLTHISDQDHAARHEMANKVGALQMALYSKLNIPME